MYSNGGSLGIVARKPSTSWDSTGKQTNFDNNLLKTGKRFVRCICPKCDSNHNVHMLWTGRGTPRKYCGNCKPLVAGYDDAAIYEASISAPGHSKKRGTRHDSE
jgi:hypothetical protein